MRKIQNVLKCLEKIERKKYGLVLDELLELIFKFRSGRSYATTYSGYVA